MLLSKNELVLTIIFCMVLAGFILNNVLPQTTIAEKYKIRNSVVKVTESKEAYAISITPIEDDSDYFHLNRNIIPPLLLPNWFKDSLLDLPQDLAEAQAQGKGLILYFGQHECTYCETLLNDTLSQPDIITYTQKYFDVIGFDAEGRLGVTMLNGTREREEAFAEIEQAHLTPSLIFYDKSGKKTLQLRGHQTPYQFRTALDYVISGVSAQQSFDDYLMRGQLQKASKNKMLFDKPPYNLDRSQFTSNHLLAVFFEQTECHACELLHNELLVKPSTISALGFMDNIQLDVQTDTPVLTPMGKRTTAKAWAQELGIFYTPTILIFDHQGREMLRINSIVSLLQLDNLLNTLLTQK